MPFGLKQHGSWSFRRAIRQAGVLFLVAGSVYSGSATAGDSAGRAITRVANTDNTSTDVRLLDERTDPFAAPATAPASAGGAGASMTGEEVAITDAGTLTISFSDTNLLHALKLLSMQVHKNIIPSKDVRGTVTADLYDVTIREALDSILHANGFAYREQGNFLYVYTVAELQKIEEAERRTSTEVFRLFYTPAANAVTMIKPVLSNSAQIAITTPATAGIQSGAGETGGMTHATEDMIVVTDFQENIERARKIIKEVDRRPQQIVIEATILRATLTEDNAFGVDFAFLGGVDFSGITAAGSNFGEALSGQIVNNPTAGGVVDRGYGVGNTGFTQGVPQGGLRIGLVTNNIQVFLQALDQVTDTTVLANPKILALNKQKGEVIVGRKDGYLTTSVTETTTVQTVEFLDTGTRLIFRPFIGDDGYVRMEIHPEDSSGGLTDSNLPFKVTTEVTSNVMVKDGHTIVIGGLFREDTNVARGQVPFLGNIPLAGNLFKRQRDRTTREEVIILLTPHIIKDDVAYAQASEEELKVAQMLRVGTRKGMMIWGRERLADRCYESAMEELRKSKPNRGKAMWNLNCATNLNPKFLEAIKLKEQLTSEQITAADNSSIRFFLKRQILAEKVGNVTTQPAIGPQNPILDSPQSSPKQTELHPTAAAPATQPQAELATADKVLAMPAAGAQAELATADKAPAMPATQPLEAPVASIAAPAMSGAPAEPDMVPADAASVAPTIAMEVTEVIEAVPATQPVPPRTTVTELPLDPTNAGDPTAP